MTKIPTAIAILQLQEQGRLNIDSAVTEYLPWFEVTYPSDTSQVITVRDLLQHTSGLPDTVPAIIGWVHYDDATRDQTEIVKRFTQLQKLKLNP
jgi:CubicO group peptidase (beta-lactamase class C family)